MKRKLREHKSPPDPPPWQSCEGQSRGSKFTSRFDLKPPLDVATHGPGHPREALLGGSLSPPPPPSPPLPPFLPLRSGHAWPPPVSSAHPTKQERPASHPAQGGPRGAAPRLAPVSAAWSGQILNFPSVTPEQAWKGTSAAPRKTSAGLLASQNSLFSSLLCPGPWEPAH